MSKISPEQLLKVISETEIPDSIQFCVQNGYEHEQFVGVMNSLIAKEMIVAQKQEQQVLQLTQEGSEIVEKGSAEFRVFSAVPAEGITNADLNVKKII